MTLTRLVAAGLLVYGLALLVTIPATLVDAAIRRASEGRLRLAEAQGTVWAGGGQLEILDPAGQVGVAKSLTWRLLPGSLFGRHAVYELRLDQAAKPFPAAVSFSRVELSDAEVALPASTLGLAVPKLAPLGLSGDLLLQVRRLSAGPGGMRADATVQWRRAGSALTRLAPLGDYELRVEDLGSALNASLRTLSGPLQLDGRGSWGSGGNPVFVATARVPAQHREQLEPLLQLIAIRRGPGEFELRLK